MPHSNSPSHRVVLLLLLVAALALRLPGFTESVWIDELYTSRLFVGEPEVLLRTLYSDIHPPAYFVFMHLWTGLFGDSEVSLRIPPLLSGLATILLLSKAGAVLAGPNAGLVAAALLAFSPVHVWYSREGRPYATIMLVTVACVLAFLALQRRPDRKRVLLFTVLLFLLVFLHYYMVALAAAFAAAAMVRGGPARRPAVVASAAAVAAFVLYLVAKAHFSEVPTEKGYLRPFTAAEAWALFFRWFPTGNSLDPLDAPWEAGRRILLVVQTLLVVAVLRGAWRLLRGAGGKEGAWLLAFTLALPALLFCLQLAGFEKTYIERSALPALPLFLCVVAAGTTGWASAAARRAAGILATAVVAGVLVAFFVFEGRWTVYKPNPDWRAAAFHLRGIVDREEGLHVLYADDPSPTPLTYYDRRFQEGKTFQRNEQAIARLRARARGVLGPLGPPGRALLGFVDRRLGDLDERMERDRRGMRLVMHELKRDTSIPEDLERFFVLVHPPRGPDVDRVLSVPGARVADRREWRWLVLYEVVRGS